MMNMIKSDFYRLFRSMGIYIGLALMLLMIGVSIYLVQPGIVGMTSVVTENTNSVMEVISYDEFKELSVSDLRELMMTMDDYDLDRDILAQDMNLYYIFIFVVAIVLTADFSNGCVKNTLSSAISRNRYYFSKYVIITVCCLALFFLNAYIAYFSNLLFNGKNLASSLGAVTKVCLLQLPPILTLISILTGIAFAVKKTAIFNTAAIPLIIVFQLLLNLAATVFHINPEHLQYELQTMLILLANNPSKSYILRSYLICAVLIAAFSMIGYFCFRKAEIKC